MLRLKVKKIVHKSAEATGDLVGNKIADKIASMGRSKELRSKELGSAVGPAVKLRSKKEKNENEHNGRNTRNLYSSRKEKANN